MTRCACPYRLAALIGLVISLCPDACLGDGGTLRAWKQSRNLDVAVFTDPTPIVTGPMDISILLLDRRTGDPIPETITAIEVEVSPADRPAEGTRRPATAHAATNKLMRAALFDLREPGRYNVSVRIEGAGDLASIPFVIEVGTPWTPRTGIWVWILWPVPLIALYVIHRSLVRRSRARLRRGPESEAPKGI